MAVLLAALVLAQSANPTPLPRMLIVQVRGASPTEEGADLNLLDDIADEFAKDGRVAPIRWAKEDPLFKEVLGESEAIASPTDDEINDFARKLKVQYIFIAKAYQLDGKVYPKAEVFQSGRRGALWRTGPTSGKESQSFVVTIDGAPSWPDTTRSLARTWVSQLIYGPLKDLPKAGAAAAPAPNNLDIKADPGGPALEKAQELIASGRADMAVVYLKDAVDANPFDSNRRILLMELLDQLDLPAQAADEGRRAARMTGSKPELWLFSARSWMLAGKKEEAKADLIEARARGVDSPLAHRLLGDMAMLSSQLEEARDEYSLALEKEDSMRTRLGLALVFALEGKPGPAKTVLEPVKMPENGLSAGDYAFAVKLIDESIKPITKLMAELLPRLRVQGGKPELLAEAIAGENRARALSEVISSLAPPLRNRPSHAARELAHKLLFQASQEILSFAKGSDAEAGAEATLSLGEALKQLQYARETYVLERIYGQR